MIRTLTKDDSTNLSWVDMVALATAIRNLAATYRSVGLNEDASAVEETAAWYERKAQQLRS